MPRIPFRGVTAIYLLLGRYTLSFQLASTLFGRKKEQPFWQPIQQQLSLRATNRRHSHSLVQRSLIFRASKHLGDNQFNRYDRSSAILKRLTQKIKSAVKRLFKRQLSNPQDIAPSNRSICDTAARSSDALLTEKMLITEEASASALNDINYNASLIEPMEQDENSPTVLSIENQSDRSATADSTTDLTGTWRLMVTKDFTQQYDKYLQLLGQPMLVRSVALSIIGMTTEETRQDENGRLLWIKGTNPRGIWERVLTASAMNDLEDQKIFEIQTIDKETVQAEAWWENDGTRHTSWLRGVSRYGGGSFESVRYLESPDVLICESAFHPNDKKREVARVTWRFVRSRSSK